MPYQGQIMNYRPFYIWILGNKQGIKKIIKDNIINNYKNVELFGIDYDDLSLTLLPQPRKGKISFPEQNNSFTCAEVSKKYPVLITLGLNLRHLPAPYQDIDYLLKNLQFSRSSINCKINVYDAAGIQKQKNFDQIAKKIENLSLTHFITLEFDNLNINDTEFSIYLIKEKPSWINTTSIDDDVNLTLKELEGKTFSLRYLVGAFERKFGNEEIFRINFELQPLK